MYSELLIHDGLGGIAINQLVQYSLYRAYYMFYCEIWTKNMLKFYDLIIPLFIILKASYQQIQNLNQNSECHNLDKEAKNIMIIK